MGILSIRHPCENVRSHARISKPLARGFRISPDANRLRGHHCARLRKPNTGGATDPLSATSAANLTPASVHPRQPSRCHAPANPWAV